MRVVFGRSVVGSIAFLIMGVTSLAAQSRLRPGLDAVVRTNLAHDHAVGAVVAVLKGSDTLFFSGYGKMDVEADIAMQTDAIFGIGSITKQFTAAAVLKLRDEGKLRLDDDITKWLPDFETHGHDVPLRRLLDHTSGIHDFTETRRFRDLMWSASFSADSIYEMIKRHPPQVPPGTAQVYNNTAYWLLHLVIERASGMSYQRYIESRLFEPLGMNRSTFCLNAEEFPGRATGYHVRNGRVRRAPLNVSTWYMGSGALCSTAEDLVTWLQSLHGGAVLSPESYAEMIRPGTLLDGTRTRYAMGLQVGADARGLDVIGHSGEIAGYGARANWYPDARMAVVVLINNSGDVSATAMAQDLAAEVLPVTDRDSSAFGGDVALLVGMYRGIGRGGEMVVEVTRKAKEIAVSVDGGPARPLSWTGGLTFQQGPALLTFGGASARNGAVSELRYDAGNGYYILERLSGTDALIAETRLRIEKHWLLILLAVGAVALACALVLIWIRRAARGRKTSFRGS